jgi:FAD dependent oxidoreductase TIGR03364
MRDGVDIAIVGAGIVGLAHAYAAARLGKRVVVIEREARAIGASIRNFGFITVTGQERGAMWSRAKRSSQRWREVSAQAGIASLHDGLLMIAHRPEAASVLEAFMATEMGEACSLLPMARFKADHPDIVARPCAVLSSPHELRVESRDAIPRLAAWLAERFGVEFLWSTTVQEVDPPRLRTSRGTIMADAVIVCPGDNHTGLFSERIAPHGLTRSKLQMMRLADPGFRLGAGIMSDLGLVRYAGYAALPQAEALRRRLEAEQGDHLKHGVHLIAVQSSDGSLVVGDSHHYGATPDPFSSTEVDALILDEFARTICARPPIIERWVGTYSSAEKPVLIDHVSDSVRLVIVTSGTGASVSFALAEDVIGSLYGISDWEGNVT